MSYYIEEKKWVRVGANEETLEEVVKIMRGIYNLHISPLTTLRNFCIQDEHRESIQIRVREE